MVHNVKSNETLYKIRTKKYVVGMTLEIIGDLDDSSLYEWRRLKPDLSDFENKWQLTQKKWQQLELLKRLGWEEIKGKQW